MTLQDFKSSLSQGKPPDHVNTLLQALWYDGKDDWHAAHNIAQDVKTPDGSWIHAYLHRKEGDDENASYWYSKANRKMPSGSLEQEWEEITQYFLDRT